MEHTNVYLICFERIACRHGSNSRVCGDKDAGHQGVADHESQLQRSEAAHFSCTTQIYLFARTQRISTCLHGLAGAVISRCRCLQVRHCSEAADRPRRCKHRRCSALKIVLQETMHSLQMVYVLLCADQLQLLRLSSFSKCLQRRLERTVALCMWRHELSSIASSHIGCNSSNDPD